MSRTHSDPEDGFLHRRGYVAVFLIGLALRAVYFVQAWHNNELIDFPIVDARVYVNWANGILAGSPLPCEPSNYTPMYPLYLAAWFLVFGTAAKLIFAGFLILGALQAVVIGKTAELIWDRRTGLVAALIAATYWPFIVHEATFYAENLALWTLSLGLLLLCLYRRYARWRYLVLSGFCLAVSSLCRANTLLCLAALSCWLVWNALRGDGVERRTPNHAKRVASACPPVGGIGRRTTKLSLAAGRLVVFLLPAILMSAPVMLWNYRLTGSPMLRTQGAECLYMGNEPDLGGLIVSPGWEWTDLEIRPLKEGKTLSVEKERFWLRKTAGIVRNRTGEWLALQARKLLMLTGNFEVSQEIDIYRYRGSSWALNLPFWPGFGSILPVAVAGIILAIRRREERTVILWLCAAVYFASIFPFQVAGRFRLLLVVPLIPFAAAFAVAAVEELARKPRPGLLVPAALLILGFAAVLPDHTGLRGRNRIDHWLFAGQKRLAARDIDGAIEAFTISSERMNDRVDSLLQLGYAYLSKGDLESASASFQGARARREGCTEAVLGLASCAARAGWDDKAIGLGREVLTRWPNSMEALRLLQGVYFRQENWPELEKVLSQMRTYVNWPADAGFQLARISEIRGDKAGAVSLYDEISGAAHLDAYNRGRAGLHAGIFLWRSAGDAQGAALRWQRVADAGDPVFAAMARCLLKKTEPGRLAMAYNPETAGTREAKYIAYTLGLEAWMRGDNASAARWLNQVLAGRNPAQLKPRDMDTLEWWAVTDLQKLKGGE